MYIPNYFTSLGTKLSFIAYANIICTVPMYKKKLKQMLIKKMHHFKATLGDRSFSFASSSVWNSIPNDVRCAPSLSSFKSRLKTYLFRSVYKD